MSKGPIELLAEGSASMAIIKMARLVERKIQMLAQLTDNHNEAIYDMEVRLSLALDNYTKLSLRLKALEEKTCCKEECDTPVSVPKVQEEVSASVETVPVPELQVPKSKTKKTKSSGKATG